MISAERLADALLVHQQQVGRVHVCIGECANLIATEYRALTGKTVRYSEGGELVTVPNLGDSPTYFVESPR